MYWKQTEENDPKTFSQIHNGIGLIKRRSIFEKRSELPIRVEIWELDEGVSEGDHTHDESHPLEEVYYFLKGEGEMTVDKKTIPVKDGDSIMVPPGVDHGIRNTGRIPLKLLIIWGVPQKKKT